jgi:hypothetical protein
MFAVLHGADTMDINGFHIELPIGLQQVLDTPVRDSYQDFLQKDDSLVRRHLTALTTLLPKYIGTPTNVLHVFGGVGATAQVIDQCCPRHVINHTFWERDPVLVDYLRTKYDDVHQMNDSYACFLEANIDRLADYDAIMFDPSVGTIKTPLMKECWDRLGSLMPDTIWLSDTACAKIHLNARFYEKDFGRPVEPTAEGYLEAYDQWLWENHHMRIANAMREAAETYAVILPGDGGRFPKPIPYM